MHETPQTSDYSIFTGGICGRASQLTVYLTVEVQT